MYLLAFFAFLRCGEICKSKHTLMFHQVQLSQPGEAGYLTVIFYSFKHNTDSRPFRLKVQAREPASLCPVKALQKFITVRGTDPGPLFCFPGGLPVPPQLFAEQLRTDLNFCNLDTRFYKSHSFRIGAASYALSQGCSDSAIQIMGRWRSDAFKKYLRFSTVISI